jgi:hypothetical protein
LKSKHLSHSSLRDINKRYGRTIRFPIRRKRAHRLRRAADSHKSGKKNNIENSTRRNRIILWSIIIATTLVLGAISHIRVDPFYHKPAIQGVR